MIFLRKQPYLLTPKTHLYRIRIFMLKCPCSCWSVKSFRCFCSVLLFLWFCVSIIAKSCLIIHVSNSIIWWDGYVGPKHNYLWIITFQVMTSPWDTWVSYFRDYVQNSMLNEEQIQESLLKECHTKVALFCLSSGNILASDEGKSLVETSLFCVHSFSQCIPVFGWPLT